MLTLRKRFSFSISNRVPTDIDTSAKKVDESNFIQTQSCCFPQKNYKPTSEKKMQPELLKTKAIEMDRHTSFENDEEDWITDLKEDVTVCLNMCWDCVSISVMQVFGNLDKEEN
jgi:hypothetical protein